MIDLSQYELKEVYRKVLDHLSDDDKIRISIENYNIEKLKDIIVYYDLQENPLLNTLALTKYGKDAWRSYRYAKYVIQGRWLEVEDTIKTDPKQAYRYAKYVIQGRWLEAEEYIKTNPYWAYCYALDVIKGRWTEAEEYIKNDPKWASYYAKYVIRGRFPEAEEYIKTDPEYARRYAENVMKDIYFWDKN